MQKLLSILVAIALTASFHATAQNPRPLNIPAGDLTTALEALAKQAGVEVVYRPEQLKGLHTKGVKGTYSSTDAVVKLLNGTNLTLKTDASGMLLITTPDNAQDAGSKPTAQSSQEETRLFRLTQVGANQQSSTAGTDKPEERTAEGADSRGIQEILVRDSRLKSLNTQIRRSKDDAQPYVVFDRESIEQSGAFNLEDFFKKRLTMSTGSSTLSQTSDPKGNVSEINLRGLGADETLILVDGRRIANFGSSGQPQQPDINGIPLAAIERIEVLPTTASGIYGGGATGGVINIIMRRDYAGMDVNLNYGNTFDTDAATRRIDLSGGFSLEDGRTSILLAASWTDANPLLTGDRDFETRRRAHLLQTSPATLFNAFSPIAGSTTNIRAVNLATPLTLKGSNIPLGSPFAYVPIGYAGVNSDNGLGFTQTAGAYNLELPDTAQGGGSGNGARQALVNAPTVRSIMATVQRDFTSSLSAFAEISRSENSGAFVRGPLLGAIVIAGGAAANPFNQQIRITIPTLGADTTVESDLEVDRIAAGLILQLGRDWSVGLDHTWNRSEFSNTHLGGIDSTAIMTAIGNGTLNVFRDLALYPVDFTPYFLPQNDLSPGRTTLSNTSLRASGTLPWALSAGTPAISALLERRKEVYGAQRFISEPGPGFFFRNLYPEQTQEVDSLYVEVMLPLIGAREGLDAALLELQLAARNDRYRTVGSRVVALDEDLEPLGPIVRSTNKFSSTNPTVALRMQPLRDLALRASYGTGFLPPAVHQLVPTDDPIGQNLSAFLRDPLRGNEPLGIVQGRSGGNPDLDPEESESWSAGMIFTPRLIQGLRFSADWSQIDKTGNIANLSATLATQAGLEDVMRFLPERIIRGAPSGGYPVGPITLIDSSLVNLARLKVEAVDFATDYAFEVASVGGFELTLNATRLLGIETQLIETAPVVEGTGVGVLPLTLFSTAGIKWRINGGVTWRRNEWTVNWSTRYYDDYYINSTRAVVAAQGSAVIKSQQYHDLFIGYRWPDATGFGLLANSELQLGVNNVFNTRPPIDVVGNGFNSPGYSYFGDPRMANYYVTLRKSFGAGGR